MSSRRQPARLPSHYIAERARFRRMVERRRDLTPGARTYASWLAFQRWGAGHVAAARAKAAYALGCSIRSVQRWNAELVAAGLLEVVEQGGIVAGKRLVKVFRMVFPQVNRGDTMSPQGSDSPLQTRVRGTRRTRRTLAEHLATPRTPHPTRPHLAIPLF